MIKTIKITLDQQPCKCKCRRFGLSVNANAQTVSIRCKLCGVVTITSYDLIDSSVKVEILDEKDWTMLLKDGI